MIGPAGDLRLASGQQGGFGVGATVGATGICVNHCVAADKGIEWWRGASIREGGLMLLCKRCGGALDATDTRCSTCGTHVESALSPDERHEMNTQTWPDGPTADLGRTYQGRNRNNSGTAVGSALLVVAIAAGGMLAGVQATSCAPEPSGQAVVSTTAAAGDTALVWWSGEHYPRWEMQAAEAWYASDQEFGGLERVAGLWSSSPWVVKIVIGNAILTGIPEGAADLLSSDDAEAEAMGSRLVSAFLDSEYGDLYGDDLDRLRERWHLPDGPYDPKYLIGLRVLAGEPVE